MKINGYSVYPEHESLYIRALQQIALNQLTINPKISLALIMRHGLGNIEPMPVKRVSEFMECSTSTARGYVARGERLAHFLVYRKYLPQLTNPLTSVTLLTDVPVLYSVSVMQRASAIALRRVKAIEQAYADYSAQVKAEHGWDKAIAQIKSDVRHEWQAAVAADEMIFVSFAELDRAFRPFRRMQEADHAAVPH